MKFSKISLLLAAALFVVGTPTAHADEASDRTVRAAAVASRWNPIFDQQYSQITSLASKAALDPAVMKSYKNLLADFLEVRRVIDSSLANPTGDVDAASAYAEEETGEFTMTISGLTKQVAIIKKFSCVKGKVIKKVSGITPKCPAGYKKK